MFSNTLQALWIFDAFHDLFPPLSLQKITLSVFRDFLIYKMKHWPCHI